jgi:hypothetical protein
MNEDDLDHDFDEGVPEYADPATISAWALPEALCRLRFLGDDMFLRMQTTNIGVVDQFIMRLETEALSKLYDEGGRDMELGVFLSAQSQMWIFAIDELLRTWRERARAALDHMRKDTLKDRIAALRSDKGFRHHGEEALADQLQALADDPQIAIELDEHLRRSHIPYARLDHLRVALAKHEVKGKRGALASAPGYGRYNAGCGAFDYQIEAGRAILDTINRRDIADEFRAMWNGEAPTAAEIEDFKAFMKGVDDKYMPDFGDF